VEHLTAIEHFCRLLAKVRLGLKCLTGTNAPAYFGVAYMTKRKKKKFYKNEYNGVK